ncbi:CCDC47 [Bugula neritina]|uniref:PAT complex subunit CCDC47 n=1 Tax=Bugula neritina TaxID=10212 RepID=A0A7J7IZB0_BUGNE|nr:CCDC47 [Bugula neritina]
MKWQWLILVSLCVALIAPHSDDNDFAEFDEEEFETSPEFEDDLPQEAEVQQSQDKQDVAETNDFYDEGTVEVEDDFDSFDAEEFEGMETEPVATEPIKEELRFAKVPMNLRRDWANYYVEMVLLTGMFIYFIAMLVGRSKNTTLAQAWFKANKDLLEASFSIVGDDGNGTEPNTNVLMKHSDHTYVMWCSGRIGMEGMLVQLRMVKRQDLVNFLQRMVKPMSDQIVIQIRMEKDDMENFVFCLAQKRSAVKLHKDMEDLAKYIESKKKVEEYGISDSYQVLSEFGEVTKTFLSDSKVLAFLRHYEGVLEFMHFSDQFSGPKPMDENEQKKMPDTSKALTFCFNLGKKGNTSSQDLPPTTEWTKFALYCAEKCRKYRLSREGKAKSDKNRQKMQEEYAKLAHQQRTELAQQRREEKLKAETERYMNEEDPIKARKLEEKRQKKEQARKLSKMKAVKIKSS